MNRATFQVWILLINRSNTWIGLKDLAYEMDLTSRQIIPLVRRLPNSIVDKRGDGQRETVAIRLSGTQAFIDEVHRAVTREYHGVTDEEISKVREALTEEWMTSSEICARAAIPKSRTIHALGSMEGVEVREAIKGQEYRLKGDDRVRYDIRTAVSSAQLIG